MVMQYIDGFVFSASSKTEACVELWRSMKFNFHRDLNDWMKSNATVAKNAFGVELRFDSADNHFDDLVKSRMLVVVKY